MSSLFTAFLESLPKNRSEMVADLALPDDLTASPYLIEEAEDSMSLTSDSLISDVMSEDGRAPLGSAVTKSSESSLALSRAMTDSDIDYERFHRLKGRSFSDPWRPMRRANEAFPHAYLTSLDSFMDTTSMPVLPPSYPLCARNMTPNQELREKMERFFAEECSVFLPDDPALSELQEALLSSEGRVCNTDSTIEDYEVKKVIDGS